MAIKNILFMSSCYSAYSMYRNTTKRDWNDRALGFGLEYPSRIFQISIFRWVFIVFYIIQGSLLSAILVKTEPDESKHLQWLVNIAFDFVLVIIFCNYYHNCHNQSVEDFSYQQSSLLAWILPRKSYVRYPTKGAVALSTLMMYVFYSLFFLNILSLN